ncbi:MAG: CoA-binding protein [Dehalococcoidia bacterium]|nr:CoA-binding protein [Dehalococcoidia bacterium]
MSNSSLDFIFHPQSVAIVGASENVAMLSGNYVQHLVNYGFKGNIYPINPKRPTIFGVKAYPDLKSIPGNIDYVIDCIALEDTPALLAACSQKGVQLVHVFAGRAAETGHKDSIELEQKILQVARQYGIRLIGPNCLGIYCPGVGLSTGWDFPKEPGTVGAAIQSGGNSTDLVRWGALRGMRFSKVISYGNALDLNESDFLEYLAGDPETRVIMCYFEGVKDGRRFFDILRSAARQKPVIILKGGRTRAGSKAASTHTASLAGSYNMWSIMIKQAGAIQALNFDDWVDLGVAFSMVSPIKGTRVGITGGGGGRSVLSADECEEMGFDVVPLPSDIREQIREKAPIIWDWVGNPVDVSIMRGTSIGNAEVLTMMAKHPDFDFLIGQITEDIPSVPDDFMPKVHNEVDGYIQIFKGGLKPIVVVQSEKSLGINEFSNWRWRLFAEARTQFVEAKVPFFPTIGRAARAVKEVINYYQRKGS